jgi:hypothetical protein
MFDLATLMAKAKVGTEIPEPTTNPVALVAVGAIKKRRETQRLTVMKMCHQRQVLPLVEMTLKTRALGTRTAVERSPMWTQMPLTQVPNLLEMLVLSPLGAAMWKPPLVDEVPSPTQRPWTPVVWMDPKSPPPNPGMPTNHSAPRPEPKPPNPARPRNW